MSPALFQTALYASLALCVLGLFWRASAWLRVRIGADVGSVTLSQRIAAVFRGAATALLSRRALRLPGTLFLDVLLLRRLYASGKLRWLGHLLAMAGFALLLLMHALAPLVSARLFQDYQPTLNPYLFLRNLFGVMVLAGVALLLYGRRRRGSGFPQAHGALAAAFIALLAGVLVTGFLLESVKFASPRAFYRMTAQFAGSSDPEQLKPLRALWAREFGVVFDDLKEPLEPSLVEQGRALHRDACASCHAKPESAFVSYPLARTLAPAAGQLEAGRADAWLLYLHVFAGFLGLASLPFTRFFHVLTAPLSLLVDAAAAGGEFAGEMPSKGALAARRALALDACVRCGICDVRCSVAPLARYLGNRHLLPSHKLVATGALASGGLMRSGEADEALRVADGAFLCTDCGRCTKNCPVGLDLEDLWAAGRDELAAAGLAAPALWVQARPALEWAELLERRSATPIVADAWALSAPLSADRGMFSRCIQCQTCTNVCPVVAHSTDPGHGTDLTPQKVMNLLRLGLRDLTLGSRMVWDCATCYKCQEYCPESIRVTDIMCELRALALQRLGAVRGGAEPS